MGGTQGRMLDVELGGLQDAVESLRLSTYGFNERVDATINLLSKRLDRLETVIVQISAKDNKATTNQSSLAFVLGELNDQEKEATLAQAEASQLKEDRLSKSTFSTSSLDGLEDYQLFRKDTDRVSIYAKKKDVWLEAKHGEGFGITLVEADGVDGTGNTFKATFIKAIKPGGCAARDNTLCTSDRIIAINGIDVANSTSKQVVGMIKASGSEIRLTVASLDKMMRQRARKDNESNK
eukprot:m.44499 g.44499  ORF g.44499 m.44499 type:complete len:237 (+) comp7176_c0_seq1:72-782(+)